MNINNILEPVISSLIINGVSLLGKKIKEKYFNNNKLKNPLLRVNSNEVLNEKKNELYELIKEIEKQYSMYPYWRYNVNIHENGKISISNIPIYNASSEKNLLRGKVRYKLPIEYNWANNMNDLIKYSYENQTPINLDIDELKIWAGDCLIEDKKSNEDNRISLKIINKEFPPPRPIKIEFGENKFSIDYLKLGVTKINGDMITLSNKRDKSAKIFIEFILDLKKKENCKFYIEINEGYESNVEANLYVNGFLSNCDKNINMKIIDLESGKILIEFNDTNIENKESEKIILKKKTKLLKKLHEIERYYDVGFNLPDENIQIEDLKNIEILLCSMKNKRYKTKCNSIKLELIINKKNDLYNMIKKNKSGVVRVSLDRYIDLFNQRINFKEAYVKFNDFKVKNKKKILKKLETLKEGDTIIVEFIANNSNKCSLTYK